MAAGKQFKLANKHNQNSKVTLQLKNEYALEF